jgi:exodeoxyribonuclease VII large subunit
MLTAPHSVSQFVAEIKILLEDEFSNACIEGEVSNFTKSSTGHYYFNLSDEHASLACALFKGDSFRNPLISQIRNGSKIIITGPVSLYLKRGTFQVLVKTLRLANDKGGLLAQYEALKQKLMSEGLFDLKYKKEIPKLPKKIAIITALGGAALQDFLNIIKRRSLWYDILILPSLMQGDQAATSIIKRINYLSTVKNEFDVILITRGGGSMEDLWSFNDEKLARAIFACPIPVISAIGHQVDYTLCDFVADLRLETPSAAAEILSQEQTQMKNRLILCGHKLCSIMQNKTQVMKKKLERYNLEHRGMNLSGIYGRIQHVDELGMRLHTAIKFQTSNARNRLQSSHQYLDTLNPNKVLKRGYSIIKDAKHVMSSHTDFSKLERDAILSIHFHDGIGKIKKV